MDIWPFSLTLCSPALFRTIVWEKTRLNVGKLCEEYRIGVRREAGGRDGEVLEEQCPGLSLIPI